MAVLALALATGANAQTVRYVNTSGNNTAACAIAASPCKTITYAMTQAVAGDTIAVFSGTYNTALGEAFPIAMKSGVQLRSTDGPVSTVIDAAGSGGNRVFNSTGGTSATLIDGFTIRGGFQQALAGTFFSYGGAMFVSGASEVRINGNVFTANEVVGPAGPNGGVGFGGAIYVADAAPVIWNNVFIANIARGGKGDDSATTSPGGAGGAGQGGAIFANGGVIVNNTFHSNQAIGGTGGTSTGGGPAGAGGNGSFGAVLSANGNVVNNIFAANSAVAGVGGAGSPGGAPGTASYGALRIGAANATNNLFFNNVGGADDTGTNAVTADPRFHFAPSNLRIGVSSPAKAAGTATGAPIDDFDTVTRPNPPSRGAFESSGADLTDLDGSGRSDILYRHTVDGRIRRLLLNGLATTDDATVYTDANLAWSVIADADFDGDGVTDLLWRNATTGQHYMMPFGPNGSPKPGQVIYTEANAAWKVVFTPDFDGDGKADLLWRNSTTGQVYAMRMNGFTIAAQGVVYTEPNAAWRIVATGDFAGSGKRNQLLWQNTTTGQVYLMTVTFAGGGFTQTGQFIYVEANTNWKILAAPDFNGDARSDLLWRNATTGQVYAMLMNGGTVTSQGLVHVEPDLAWKIVSQGDYNGDLKADLLWRNESTGQVYMMQMNGLSIATQGMVHTEPDTAWKLLGPWEYSQ